MGAAVLSTGCEGFCLGGVNNDLACTNDSDCVNATCVGIDPVTHPGTCNCICQSSEIGTPSTAGAMGCQLGLQINVELPSNGVCGDTPTIVLAPLCSALTTGSAVGQLIDANNSIGQTIPPTPGVLSGAATSCASLSTSVTAGLKLVGQLSFFDSTLGDIYVSEQFACQ
jgi:hypothetical protein